MDSHFHPPTVQTSVARKWKALACVAILCGAGCARRHPPELELATTLDALSTAAVAELHSVQWDDPFVRIIYTDLESLSLVRLSRDLAEAELPARIEYIDQVGVTPVRAIGSHAYLRTPIAELCWYLDVREEPTVKLIRRRPEDELWRIDLPPVTGRPLYAVASTRNALLFTWDTGLWVQRTDHLGRETEAATRLLLSETQHPAAQPVSGHRGFSFSSADQNRAWLVSMNDDEPVLSDLANVHAVHATIRRSELVLETLTYDQDRQELLHITHRGTESTVAPLTRSRATTSVAIVYLAGRPFLLYTELTLEADEPVYSISLLYSAAATDASVVYRKQLLHLSSTPVASITARGKDNRIQILFSQNGLWLLGVETAVTSP